MVWFDPKVVERDDNNSTWEIEYEDLNFILPLMLLLRAFKLAWLETAAVEYESLIMVAWKETKLYIKQSFFVELNKIQ